MASAIKSWDRDGYVSWSFGSHDFPNLETRMTIRCLFFLFSLATSLLLLLSCYFSLNVREIGVTLHQRDLHQRGKAERDHG